ncbi:hypothetical protein ACFOUP_02595 [Belliella kenyensis]|uniref:Uncharacterized protein n=1 Tax=Belliella kenyensis TaxID=1472724 RepID=A0ABV8EIP3_9BACT|nr:hypothetical protein [Belliella kenyensis]MCH7400912.1 hypothetical protein [Belliella kenyensis]MDN3603911.1 hypothetical protein [Belliella kenyensis]
MEDQSKIRLTQKTLASGNCQVKFIIEDEVKPQYGYLLVNEPKSVGEIMEEIKRRMENRRKNNPFSLNNPIKDDHNFYLFSA